MCKYIQQSGDNFFFGILLRKKCLKYKILKEKKLKSSSPSMKNVPSSLMPKVSIMRQF